MENLYPCETCGKMVFKRASRLKIRPHVFCSRECLKSVPKFKCTTCGKPIHRKASHTKDHMFCSRECTAKSPIVLQEPKIGENHPQWKGGMYIRDGYVFLKRRGHPNANKAGWIAEHRLVMSEHLGRPLESNEIVHHKDENTSNNNLDNLQIVTTGDHGRIHRAIELHGWRRYTEGCVECGTKDRRHYGHGLCVRCYMRKRAREARLHINN